MDPLTPDPIGKAIRTLRMVVLSGAVWLSILGVAAVAAPKDLARDPGAPPPEVLQAALAFACAGSIAGYVFVYRRMLATLRSRPDVRMAAHPPATVVEAYRTITIVRSALVEAAGLVGAVDYFFARASVGLAVAALSLLLLIATLPSRAGLQKLAEEAVRLA